MARTNYIFVDFENRQETDLDRIAGKPVKVIFLLGTRHKSLPVEFVQLILKYAAQTELIQSEVDGKNALDFVLACQVGVFSVKDPAGYFHVVSKDTGFDALIKHLKDQDLFAARHESFADIPMLMNAAERARAITQSLQTGNGTRPAKRPALESFIQQRFGKALSAEELDGTIKDLIAQNLLTISNTGEIKYFDA